MIRRLKGASKAILVAALIYPQFSLAEESKFTSADVLAWEEAAQESLFQNSVVMTGIIAAQSDDTAHIATCIDGWWTDEAIPERIARIRSVMENLRQYHPQAVILAVIEDACGEFGE